MPGTSLAASCCQEPQDTAPATVQVPAANSEGKREIIGLHIGPSEATIFRSDILKKLKARSLIGYRTGHMQRP
jgi:hypothetical protein